MQSSDGIDFGDLTVPGRQFAHIFSSSRQTSPVAFHLAVNFLGLRRNGSWSQIINQAQDFPEQFLRHGNFGQLERGVAAMADHLGTDL